MQRLRLIIGIFVIGFSVAAMLSLGVRRGFSAVSLVVVAFFVATSYAGWQLLRANWKNEREHVARLTQLIDEARDEKPPSDGSGGADPGDQSGK